MTTRSAGMITRTGEGRSSGKFIDNQNAPAGLLTLGIRARLLARRGANLAEVARYLGVRPRLALLAILFTTSQDTLKLRAMVEEWTLVKTLGEIRNALPR